METKDKISYTEKADAVNDDKTLNVKTGLPPVKPITRQQNENFRNKVLIRKRKRSKHPLRELRIRAGYTLEELAQITELSPSYLSRLESGSRRLNADILQGLSIALGCSPAELLPYNSNFMGASDEGQTGVHPASAQADLPVYELSGDAKKGNSINLDKGCTYMTRPADLVGITGAIACDVTKANFGPRYQEGDRLMLHPSTPLTANCSIVTITKDNKVFIGKFVAWNMPSATATPSQLLMDVTSGAPNDPATTERKVFEYADLKATYRVIAIAEAGSFVVPEAANAASAA